MDKERLPHDQSYKMLFSDPEMVSSLLLDFVPESFVHDIDFSTLDRVSGSYVTDDCRERHDDIVWRVRYKEEWVYLYILLEFQSGLDPWMAVRILGYTALLWQDLIRRGEIEEGKKLPPVFPLVLYNGGQKWTAAQDVADLQFPIKGPLEAYQPRQKYFLIEESQVSEECLADADGIAAFLLRLERANDPGAILPIIRDMIERLRGPQYRNLRRAFTIWLTRVAFRRSELIGSEAELTDLQEVESMLAERAPLWKQEYIHQGISIGEAKGRMEGISIGEARGEARGISIGEANGLAMALQDYLESRFGVLSQEVRSRIAENPDPQCLRELTRTAYRTDSFEVFLEELKKYRRN